MPLALRVSHSVRSAVIRRAVAADVDPGGSDFPKWLGDLVVAGLPAVVGDLLRCADDPEPSGGGTYPFDAATPPALAEGATSDSSRQTHAERHHTARRPVEGASGAAS